MSGRLNLGVVVSRYDEVFFSQAFDDERSDTLTDISAQITWRMSPRWELAHSLAFYANRTEVDIFEYDRLVTTIEVRRVWE